MIASLVSLKNNFDQSEMRPSLDKLGRSRSDCVVKIGQMTFYLIMLLGERKLILDVEQSILPYGIAPSLRNSLSIHNAIDIG